jgi:hypothetical protein
VRHEVKNYRKKFGGSGTTKNIVKECLFWGAKQDCKMVKNSLNLIFSLNIIKILFQCEPFKYFALFGL